MAKKRAKPTRPTIEEAEELIREMDELVFQGQQLDREAPAGFDPGDVPARLQAIDWFTHCGEPAEFNLNIESEQVKTWVQAGKAIKSRSSENAWLEAQNQLTMFLHANALDRYRGWNDHVKRFNKEVITPLTKKVWEPFRKKHELDPAFVQTLQWITRGALMEYEYLDCGHPVFFFMELLPILEAGHLPCGWKGNWPKGKLIIF